MSKKISKESIVINTEEPTRIKNFHEALQSIKWTDDEYIKNLETIYDALIEVALNDLIFYNNQRTKNKTKSYWVRQGSLIFGVLGTLMMAIPGTAQGIESLRGIPFITFSFISFALAGGMFTWNQWFFASDSHIRYVVAQFDLGEAIVKFTLNWQKWLKQNKHYSDDELVPSEVVDRLIAGENKISAFAYACCG
jgi:RNAse (barnase) inhibitor barstar